MNPQELQARAALSAARDGEEYLMRLAVRYADALREIVRGEAVSEYSSIYAAPGEFAAVAKEALDG